jgi:hypothetical protein
MTNLIEKSLLLGFGIFTLTIFSFIIVPYLGKIAEFNQNERNNLESYMVFIEEIDQGINYVVQNPTQNYLKEIEYPNYLNISIYDHIVKYEFIVENKICVKFVEYNSTFINNYFHSIHPQTYLLNVSCHLSRIGVYIINLP